MKKSTIDFKQYYYKYKTLKYYLKNNRNVVPSSNLQKQIKGGTAYIRIPDHIFERYIHAKYIIFGADYNKDDTDDWNKLDQNYIGISKSIGNDEDNVLNKTWDDDNNLENIFKRIKYILEMNNSLEGIIIDKGTFRYFPKIKIFSEKLLNLFKDKQELSLGLFTSELLCYKNMDMDLLTATEFNMHEYRKQSLISYQKFHSKVYTFIENNFEFKSYSDINLFYNCFPFNSTYSNNTPEGGDEKFSVTDEDYEKNIIDEMVVYFTDELRLKFYTLKNEESRIKNNLDYLANTKII